MSSYFEKTRICQTEESAKYFDRLREQIKLFPVNSFEVKYIESIFPKVEYGYRIPHDLYRGIEKTNLETFQKDIPEGRLDEKTLFIKKIRGIIPTFEDYSSDWIEAESVVSAIDTYHHLITSRKEYEQKLNDLSKRCKPESFENFLIVHSLKDVKIYEFSNDILSFLSSHLEGKDHKMVSILMLGKWNKHNTVSQFIERMTTWIEYIESN